MSGQPKPKNNTWLQWHNLLELLLQPVQAGNSLSASAAYLQITLEFLELTSWHPWKIAVSSHWYWWTRQDLKHSHRFNMFIYEVTQCIPSTGNSAPQAQHSCSGITYFVIPMALKETGYERESYLYTPCCRFLFEKASAVSHIQSHKCSQVLQDMFSECNAAEGPPACIWDGGKVAACSALDQILFLFKATGMLFLFPEDKETSGNSYICVFDYNVK